MSVPIGCPVNKARIVVRPASTAIRDVTPALVRKPMSGATPTTITSEITLATSDVSTYAPSVAGRAIGEEPERGVGDAGGDRDQQDAGQQ